MFWPLKIIFPYERKAFATMALIALNIVVFLLTRGNLDQAVEDYALNTNDFSPLHLISSMFMHADFGHLFGNMLFLWVYGRYVEARVGVLRFLAVYLATGVMGDVFFAVFSEGRSIGASGAVAGLMGWVIVAAPYASVEMLFFFYIRIHRFEMAALWLVGLWIIGQLLQAWMSADNVAYSAHFGGLLAGGAAAAWMRSRFSKGTSWHVEATKLFGHRPEGLSRLNQLGASRVLRTRAAKKHVVVLASMRDVPSTVDVIKLLIRRCGHNPEAALDRVEALRGGSTQRFDFATEGDARTFITEAKILGARAYLSPTDDA